MSTEPTDYMASKREQRHIAVHLDAIDLTIQNLTERLVRVERVLERAVEIQTEQRAAARITPRQREALTYMAAHKDLHLSPIMWQENGGFGGSVLPKLVEHGFVDRISGNRYRINAFGLEYLSAEAAS